MIVVADTSPLNYLNLIEQIHVLGILYGSVAIPTAVHREMLIGTLGILRDAHSAGLLDIKSSVQRLQTTNFHVAAKILAKLLRQV
jgi:predicted nucleic acid-binding protein